MNKYDERRGALAELVKGFGRGGIARVAKAIGKDANYVSRMLYPPGKDGAKRIGEDSWDLLVAKFPQLVPGDPVHQLPALRVTEGGKAATAWKAYSKASPETIAAIDLLLLPPRERKALQKRDTLVHHCIETLELHALALLEAVKSA